VRGLSLILQLVVLTSCLLVTVMIASMAVLYIDLSVYVALPLVILVAPMIAIYRVYRCCDDA
jgi:hypothetical protein